MSNLGTFIPALEAHLERPMIFVLSNGQQVPSGYHVTEFKALQYHTVDCGGVEHRFDETVIELWGTALERSREYMPAGKFLSIYNKVSPKVAFSSSADLIFLYGANGEPASRYGVNRIEPQGDNVLIYLEPDGVRCKAIERKANSTLEQLPVIGGCCTPVDSSNICC